MLFLGKRSIKELTSISSCLTTVPLKITYGDDDDGEGEMCALVAGKIIFHKI